MTDGSGHPDGHSIGDRVLILRRWRGLTQKVVADRAEIPQGYLSQIERGLAAVDKRSTIEAPAAALEVAPSELLKVPVPATDPISGQAYCDIERIGAALAHNRLGYPYREQAPPWSELTAELNRFLNDLVPACDYLAQARVAPRLIENLFAVHATDEAHRPDALVGLMLVLQHTAALLKNLGAHGMPHLAAMHMRYVADELGDPAWWGVAEWRVGQSSGGDRERMLATSVRAAEQLAGETDPRARQAYGMLHLNAAMAAAALRKPDDAYAHLSEAQEMLRATEGSGDFADMHFGPANWTTWRVAVGVELGEGPKVSEHADRSHVAELPAAERRGMFYGDLARGLAQDKTTREQAVATLRRAEEAAPQRIRTNPHMRELVTDLMRRAKREAVSRELHGMAYRMGITP
jgi:transcriptional regulator with XRE-family HTH domain